MQRRRDFAGSPVRSASTVWDAISQLVIDTLVRSPHISEHQVTTALDAAAPAGTMLIAAGYLESYPVILVADELELSLFTVSGTSAFSVDENLNPVPGAGNADDWILHLPTPEPIGSSIATQISGVAHLSSESPDAAATSTMAEQAKSSVLNLQALAERQADS